jgi:uncharacterized membrane protein
LAEIAREAPPETRRLMRWIMAIFYGVAGIFHLATPGPFLAITPNWVPAPHTIILLTGLCEIAGAAALLTRRLRWWAGVMLALYAVCVFPANIKHAFENLEVAGMTASWWYHGPRLAFQPVLVWWALFAGGIISWPARGA